MDLGFSNRIATKLGAAIETKVIRVRLLVDKTGSVQDNNKIKIN
jgi:hypothetical protein